MFRQCHAAATAEINTATEAARTVELAKELSELDPVVAADAFGSPKAQAAQRMEFAHPVTAPPPGVKPVARPLKSTTKPQ